MATTCLPISAVYADNRDPANGAEAKAKSLCSGDRRGAIWFTNSPNYYTDSVSVDGDATSVTVYIRGSVYSCNQSKTADTGATGIAATNDDGDAVGNDYRLTNISPTEFDRGTVSDVNNWSTQGGQVTATLNVQGLATNNLGKSDSQIISIDLYRCYYNYTEGKKGTCYSDPVSVTVNRAEKMPIASFDAANCSVATGWIIMMNRPDDSMETDVQIDGTTKFWGKTNQLRSDVNAIFGVTGNHGFSIDISSWVMDGGSHSVEVFTYSLDNSGAIVGGPKSIGKKAVSGCYSYTLTPTVNSVAGTASAGTQLPPVTGTISNSGPTKSYDNTIWQLTMVTVPKGGTVPVGASGATNGIAPCATNGPYNGNYLGGGGNTCQSLAQGTGSVPTSGQSVSQPAPGTLIDSNLPVGTKLCYVLSVQAHSSSDGSWQHSSPQCITIAKRPKVQVLGGDLIVGSGYTGSVGSSSLVATSTNTVTNMVASGSQSKTYGSWTQYGLVVSGTVAGMASASGYAGGSLSASLCPSLSLLTFANTGSGTVCQEASLGKYAASSSSSLTASALNSLFTPTATLPSSAVDIASLSSAVYSATGSLTLTNSSASGMPKGKWVVINAPDATVRITSDLTYTTASLSSVSEIPQLVIIAKNINIAENVKQVDAWLLATGTGNDGIINTCDTIATGSPTSLTSDKCSTKLTVNGPVLVNHLYMYRTAGSGPNTQSGDPAEVFNLRPDAYMWLANFQSASVKATTVTTTELPPRY